MGLMNLHWRHVICNAKSTWLPGDLRGFRDHDHRVHSSGDYKSPPPAHEHEGLRRYNEKRAATPVAFGSEVRRAIIQAFVGRLRLLDHRVVAAALTRTHLHALVELPDDHDLVFKEIGRCKQRASHAVRRLLPGQIWSEGGEYKRINDDAHFRHVWKYVREKQERDSLVWSVAAPENWIDDPAIPCGKIVRGTPVPEEYCA